MDVLELESDELCYKLPKPKNNLMQLLMICTQWLLARFLKFCQE